MGSDVIRGGSVQNATTLSTQRVEPTKGLNTMQAIVHFAVGIAMGLLFLTRLNLPQRKEFVAIILSGFWGLVPDGWWLFHGSGFTDVAKTWKAVHSSSFANVFWFHRFLDLHETKNPRMEIAASLLFLLCASVLYYYRNDWDTNDSRVRNP